MCDLEAVAVGQSDTRFTPFEWTTGASRTTTVVGLAVQSACADLWDNLRAKAAESAGVPVDEVKVRDSRPALSRVILAAEPGDLAVPAPSRDSGSERGTGFGLLARPDTG